MTESLRTLLRWTGTIAGLVLFVFGVHEALARTAVRCAPHATAYTCAASSGHPHVLVGVVMAAAGLAILVGSRHYFSYFG